MKVGITIATAWNDLTPRQLKRVCWLLHKKYKGSSLALLLFFVLVDVKWWQFLKFLKIVIILLLVPISELVTYYSFIYSKTDLTTFIPKINDWNAPQDRLSDLSIDELAHADDAYLKYKSTGNIGYLRVLVAVVYREVGAYNIRLRFVKNELDARFKQLNKIDIKTLLAVMRSYEGCRAHIEQKFPRVFPKPKSTNKTKVKKNKVGSQFSKIILELTGGKFGNYAETANTNAYIFLADFEDKLSKQHKL